MTWIEFPSNQNGKPTPAGTSPADSGRPLERSGSIDLGLSWPDYDLWAPDGSVPPERVAAAVLTLLLEHEEELVRERLDAAQVRRIIPGSDEALLHRVKSTRL